MDMKRRRELLEAYKNRRPQMGVISIRCLATGEVFLGTSTDTKADFNSNRAKLSMNGHPNQRLQALWNQYGESGFAFTVPETLDYENREDDHSQELETLRELLLEQDPQARRIWR